MVFQSIYATNPTNTQCTYEYIAFKMPRVCSTIYTHFVYILCPFIMIYILLGYIFGSSLSLLCTCHNIHLIRLDWTLDVVAAQFTPFLFEQYRLSKDI